MEKHDWLAEPSVETTLKILETLTSALALRGGQVGRHLLELVQARNYVAVLAYVFDYNLDWEISQLIACRQIQALYKKLPILPAISAEEREARSYVIFEEAEAKCKETNARFRTKKDIPDGFSATSFTQLKTAKRLIRKVLGPLPRICDLKLAFGPGATTTVKKGVACPQEKLADQPTCSVELAHSPWLPEFLRSIPHWLDCHGEWVLCKEDGEEVYAEHCVDLVLSTSQLVNVQKDALVDRFIEIQPTLNTLLQGGIGRWIQDRLLQVLGLDIRDQLPNQRFARVGSITHELMTLDLRSASATIARELVRYLFPEDWYQFLFYAGCADTTYKGTTRKLEMFCSMGNGYTFPLETLIFYALTVAASKGGALVRAYGDDIICETDDAPSVVNLLTLCGFMINESKCGYGKFRESCGADWYAGINIRPVYVKAGLSAEHLYVLHNFFARSFDTELAEIALSYVSDDLRLYGPDGYGDCVLVSSDGTWNKRLNRVQKRSGYGGVFFEAFRRCSRERVSIYPGDYVSPLYSVYMRREPGLLQSGSAYEEGPFLDANFSRLKFEIKAHRKAGLRESNQKFAPDGRPLWTTPGSGGYERVLIYTLSS